MDQPESELSRERRMKDVRFRAAGYLRVSTADQLDGFSIAAQLRAIRAHTDAQGWQWAGEYIDEGISAAHDSAAKRPQFRRLPMTAQSYVVPKCAQAGAL